MLCSLGCCVFKKCADLAQALMICSAGGKPQAEDRHLLSVRCPRSRGRRFWSSRSLIAVPPAGRCHHQNWTPRQTGGPLSPDFSQTSQPTTVSLCLAGKTTRLDFQGMDPAFRLRWRDPTRAAQDLAVAQRISGEKCGLGDPIHFGTPMLRFVLFASRRPRSSPPHPAARAPSALTLRPPAFALLPPL